MCCDIARSRHLRWLEFRMSIVLIKFNFVIHLIAISAKLRRYCVGGCDDRSQKVRMASKKCVNLAKSVRALEGCVRILFTQFVRCASINETEITLGRTRGTLSRRPHHCFHFKIKTHFSRIAFEGDRLAQINVAQCFYLASRILQNPLSVVWRAQSWELHSLWDGM